MFKKLMINLLGFNEDEVEDVNSNPSTTENELITNAEIVEEIHTPTKPVDIDEDYIEDEMERQINLEGSMHFDVSTIKETVKKPPKRWEPVRRRIHWDWDEAVAEVDFLPPGCPPTEVRRELRREPRRETEDHSRNIVKNPAVTVIESDPSEGPFTCDVVFSFDTTGSMSSVIQSVKQNLAETVDRLFLEIPGIRIGLIAHGDYCDFPNLMWKLDLTRDLQKIHNFISTAKTTGGGDADECYELVLETAKTMRWASEVKCLVVIGDCGPHLPGYTNHGLQYISDLEYPLTLDWRKITSELQQQKIVVFSCHAQPGRDKTVEEFYKTIASETGGYYLVLNELQAFKEYMVGICLKAADGAEDLAILRERQEQLKKEVQDLQSKREEAAKLEQERKELQARLRAERDEAKRQEIMTNIERTDLNINMTLDIINTTYRGIEEEDSEIKAALHDSLDSTPFIPSINSTASKIRSKNNRKTRSEQYEEELNNKYHNNRQFSDFTSELKSAKSIRKRYD